MKTKINKNGIVSITGMTKETYQAINWILSQVENTIQFDDDMDCYSTIDDGMITMNEKEYSALNEIKWKL